MSELPSCGLYRTSAPIGVVPAGRLVYFHNHGSPGPGIYLPERWEDNRARFSKTGITLPSNADALSLVRIAPEGFYRVIAPFYCCEQECRHFVAEQLVQLGYDAAATPILFTPEVRDGQFFLPASGVRVDGSRLDKLSALKIPIMESATESFAHDEILH